MLDLKPLLETEGANGKLERNNWGIRYVSDSKKHTFTIMVAYLVV